MIDARIPWPRLWMNIAHQIANARSLDPRLKVGCIIVPEDNTRILAMGYNGKAKGESNEPDSLEPGQSGMVHAEQNSLIKLDFNDHKRKIMYVTTEPCLICSRMIINAGITTVVYDKSYRDHSGLFLLKKSGINVFQINEMNSIQPKFNAFSSDIGNKCCEYVDHDRKEKKLQTNFFRRNRIHKFFTTTIKQIITTISFQSKT